MEVKKIISSGDKRIVVIPKDSDLKVGQYVMIVPFQLNTEIVPESAKMPGTNPASINQDGKG